MRALIAVRKVGIPDGCIGAGSVRDTVWDEVFGYRRVEGFSDVDVVYFDTRGDALGAAPDWLRVLREQARDIRWEVTNQATVHLWQTQCLGWPVRAYPSVAAAIAAWPETATAVAIRLSRDEQLEIVAPHGLEDLFNGLVRRNPTTPDTRAFAHRVAQKQWQRRWPGLRIIE